MSVAQKYKFIISQILNLNQTNLEGGGENKDHKSIIRGCTEAELIYTAFKIQQQYQNNPEGYNKSKCLADTALPVFSSYEGQENKQDVVLEKTASLQFEDTAPWLERLITRLQSRAKLLWHFSQECTCTVDNSETAPVVDLNWMQEQAKLLYLTERLHLDFEQEHWQRVVLQDKLQALCKQQVASLTEEREAFKHALCELQEDNRALREELEHAEDKIISMETGNQRLRENKQRIEDYHKERTQKLEAEFQIKIKQLRRIQEEEMEHVQEHHMRYLVSKGKHTANCKDTPPLHKGNSPPTEQQEACQEDFENLQDQRYTRSKMKDFYENNHADSYQDVKPLSEDVRFANVSSSRLGTGQKPDATNATLVKKTDKPSLLRRLRAVRSKSLKEGLSGQERMKLFDSF
ncbi:uncharacterized protein LOC133514661 [Syngnathoides biaculeatus]|uniref:uncharacterized protein LOC133514661 n=1 Tax=Syngnathoides biaculeatus TaxID=300417 RepID=UPI002ADDBF4B|nr:uncharacterized protein LOC133514661 [Syngnathoides biaculeatus]